MRIGNIGNNRITSASIKKAKKKDDSGFGELLSGANASESSEEAAGSAVVNSINPLLMLQEVEESQSFLEQEAKERGIQLLDYLDEIRNGLLLGRIDEKRLQELSELSSESAVEIDDPKLQQILKDIEIRAAVELAKLGK